MTAADGMGDDDEWSSSDDESPRPKQSKLTALLKKGVRIQQAADASAGGGPVGVPAVLAPPNISVLAPPPSASTRDAVTEVASEDIHHGRVNEGTSEAVIAEGELAEPGFAGTGTMAGAESVVGVDAATAAMRSAEEDAARATATETADAEETTRVGDAMQTTEALDTRHLAVLEAQGESVRSTREEHDTTGVASGVTGVTGVSGVSGVTFATSVSGVVLGDATHLGIAREGIEPPALEPVSEDATPDAPSATSEDATTEPPPNADSPPRDSPAAPVEERRPAACDVERSPHRLSAARDVERSPHRLPAVVAPSPLSWSWLAAPESAARTTRVSAFTLSSEEEESFDVSPSRPVDARIRRWDDIIAETRRARAARERARFAEEERRHLMSRVPTTA